MANSINTNIAAFFAQANISTASNLASSSVARLSSGNRIVQASDDVAGLAVGTSLLSQVATLKTALTNAAQGSSLLQVADGGLAQIQNILQQQQSLALQAQAGALTDTDRGFLNTQFLKLTSEIDSLAKGTTFNGVSLIDGSIATGGSNNPLRDATVGAAVSATVTGFTAGADVTGITTQLTNTGAAKNDTTFIGDLSKGVFAVTVDPTTATNYAISFSINGSTYQGSYTAAAGGNIALSNGNATITLTAGVTALTGAGGATTLQTELTTAFSGATAFALHKVASTLAKDSDGNNIAGSAITAAATQGTLLDGFNGDDIKVSGVGFDGVSLPPISNFAGSGTGTGNADNGTGVIFTAQVNGVTYRNVGATGVGTTLAATTFDGGTAGILKMYKNGDKTTNPNDYIILDFTTTTSISNAARVDTTDGVSHVVDALNGAFGSGGNAGGLTFQLGTTSDSNATINIASAKSTALYAGASLDISTQGGATTANTTVTNALNTVTAIRSNVGALESQFNFASAALQVGVQNQTAAASQFLDTDIASESTAFATQQVKLQAGISVLAQANQQLQALLKLIG